VSKASWLRHPAAPAWLIGGTFALAIAVAVVFASWRSLFDGLVREKYGTADAKAEATVQQLAAGAPWQPTNEQLEQLYRHWMRGGDGMEAFARSLATLQPQWLAQRVGRTLAAGSPEQRRRALALVTLVRLAEAKPVLAPAIARADQVGDGELASLLRATRDALP